jgi:hypothetical protein
MPELEEQAVFDTIIDPTRGIADETGSRRFALAERPEGLSGLRLGLLANTKRNADVFLEELSGVLESEYGIKAVLTQKKPSLVDPLPEQMLEKFRSECDVVAVGVGDCGSCSASAIADGVLLEQAGIPAAVVTTDAFLMSANAMAKLRGAPDYRYVTTAHPVANLDRAGVRKRAVAAAPQIVALLSRQALAPTA